MRILYNRLVNPNGRAIVTFSDPKSAGDFASLARLTKIGGNMLSTSLVSWQDSFQFLVSMLPIFDNLLLTHLCVSLDGLFCRWIRTSQIGFFLRS